MEIKKFIPNGKFFDDLAAKFDKEYISLDYRDILLIRRCKEIIAYEAVQDSSFVGNVNKFVDTFLKEVKTHIEDRNVDHVLVCMIPNTEESIFMETLSHLNDFMEIFGEETECRWGLCHGEEGIPMHLIVAIGKDSLYQHLNNEEKQGIRVFLDY